MEINKYQKRILFCSLGMVMILTSLKASNIKLSIFYSLQNLEIKKYQGIFLCLVGIDSEFRFIISVKYQKLYILHSAKFGN